MNADGEDPKDVDARLGAESSRLLSEMNRLIERGRLLLRDRTMALSGQAMMPATAGTLGAVLYANPPKRLSLESEWVTLVRWIAPRGALGLLFGSGRVSGPVSPRIRRIVGDQEIAAELAIGVL